MLMMQAPGCRIRRRVLPSLRLASCRVEYGDISRERQYMNSENEGKQQAPSLFSVFGSVLASMFGVQSSSKHTQDFVHGKPIHYILVGLIVTLVFILTVWGVVKLVMLMAGV